MSGNWSFERAAFPFPAAAAAAAIRMKEQIECMQALN
jgi:hypothetical protein